MHIHLSPSCLLVMTSQCVFLPWFLYHSPASSCLFLQKCREKLTFCKTLAVWKDVFKRLLLKVVHTDRGCHHQCCRVSGFVVCFGIFLSVCLFLFPRQCLPCRHFAIWNFSFVIDITVGGGLAHWIRSDLSKIISDFPT